MGLMDFFKKGREEAIEKEEDKDWWNKDKAEEEIVKKHEVQRGESLSIIAREHYGNASLWNHIYEANKDQIDDPNLIHPGQELIIPDLNKNKDQK